MDKNTNKQGYHCGKETMVPLKKTEFGLNWSLVIHFHPENRGFKFMLGLEIKRCDFGKIRIFS